MSDVIIDHGVLPGVACPMCDGNGCGRCEDGRVSVMEALALREAMYRPHPGQTEVKPVVLSPVTGDIHKWQLARQLAAALGFAEKSGQNRVSTAARTNVRLRGNRINRRKITAEERAQFGTTRAEFVFRVERERLATVHEIADVLPEPEQEAVGEVIDPTYWDDNEHEFEGYSTEPEPAVEIRAELQPNALLIALWDIATLTSGPAQSIAIATLRGHHCPIGGQP